MQNKNAIIHHSSFIIPTLLHPNKRLQNPWNYAQLGLLIFPLMPLLGVFGLVLAAAIAWQQQYYKIIHRPLNWLLAILAGWMILSSFFAFRPLDAWLGLFNFLPFFGFFAAFSALIQTPAQLRRLAYILVVTSIPVVIIGLGQLFWGWASPVQWHDFSVWLGCAIKPQGNPPGRMASVFVYTNLLAGYLVIVFILALGLLIETFPGKGDRWKRGGAGGAGGVPPIQNPKSKIQNPLATRLFLAVAVIGNLGALILTYSRNAWTIAIFAAIAFAVYQGWQWLVGGISAIASSVFLAAFGPVPVQQLLRHVIPSYFWQRLTDQLYPNRPVETLRKTQWQFAWGLAQERPWTGWGLRNFQPLYEAKMHAWLGHPHNLFLMLTAEIGIPATLVFCGWVIWVFYQGVKLLLISIRDRDLYRTAADTIDTIPHARTVVVFDPIETRYSFKVEYLTAQERLIFFSYLVAFFACILFNAVDVTIFDLRLNTLVWLLLSAICGVVSHQRDAAYSKHR